MRLRWDDQGRGHVEIRLPEPEMDAILETCQREFPDFVIRVFQSLASEPGRVAEGKSVSELTPDLVNMQVLAAVLDRQGLPDPERGPHRELLERSFRLALHGQFRLITGPPMGP